MTTTFQENKSGTEEPKKKKSTQVWISPMDNECAFCKRKAGQDKVYLISDVRGGKVCNICAADDKIMKKQKLNKSEKRKFKVFKREYKKVKNIPHVTLDAKGKKVE